MTQEYFVKFSGDELEEKTEPTSKVTIVINHYRKPEGTTEKETDEQEE